MLFVLCLDHIENVFLCFLMYGHGKLDLKFVHGRAEVAVGSSKIYPEKAYTSGAEIANENSRTSRFGKKGLFSSGHIYFDKQLLPQTNICCREVMQIMG